MWRRAKKQCPNCTRLEKRVEAVEARLVELAEANAELTAENTALRAENERLKKENEALKERLNQNASNSSKPPSSLPSDKKKKTKKRKSRRKRGAQPGHADQQRKLYSVDEVDEIVPCKPEECECCGGTDLEEANAEPGRVQTAELPKIKPHITEYQLHTLGCRDCGHETTGKLPEGVGRRAFGPRIQALVAILSGAYRLSKREIAQLMCDAFGVIMSLGTVCNLERATSKALKEPVEEAKRFVQTQPAIHLDETGWREDKKKAWLWTAVTQGVTVFVVRVGRGKDVVRELLGDAFGGIVNSDRWVAYAWVKLKQRQLCWSHLKRNFQKLVDRGGSSATIGQALLDCNDQLFKYWRRVRDGTLTRSTFRTHAARIRDDLFAALLVGGTCRHKKTARFCENILQVEGALWTFAWVEGIEPTNNAAERAVRKPVLWRKSCFGTDSKNGSRFAERILTTVATLRSQNRSVLEYLVAVCKAKISDRPAPSLLPDTAEAGQKA